MTHAQQAKDLLIKKAFRNKAGRYVLTEDSVHEALKSLAPYYVDTTSGDMFIGFNDGTSARFVGAVIEGGSR